MAQSFDQIDYQIMLLLHQNARIPASEIARDLNANERTIRKRIDRLIRMGVFRLTAIINPEAFGYIMAVDIFLDVDSRLEDSIILELQGMPEISYIALGQGTRDVSIECRFKNNEEMHEFMRKKLPSIQGVQVKGFSLVPHVIRNIDEWMPKEEDFIASKSYDEREL